MRCIFLLFNCILAGLLVCGCGSRDPFERACEGAMPANYDPNFVIECPSQSTDHFVSIKYACSPNGEGISPPISWKGVPKEATHLRITLEDVTCSYACSKCCTRKHWVLDIPLKGLKETALISLSGIVEGADQDPYVKAITLPNTAGKREFWPFCPPKGQVHAYLLRGIAYRKEGTKAVIVGRAQSAPLLFSFEQSPAPLP